MTDRDLQLLDRLPKKDIVEYLRKNRNTAFIIWSEEDIKCSAADRNVILSEDQINDALQYLQDNAEASQGITWMSVDEAIDIVTLNE